jgi:hypothetical protein
MINFSQIEPGPFHPQAFYDEFEEAVEHTVDDADHFFGLTYATWNHNPDFQKEVKVKANKITGSTSTADPIYGFVSRGTAVRYATMTPDFEAKTRSGVLASYPGRGGLAYISRSKPRPGIEARNFEPGVKRVVEPIFKSHVKRALNEAAKKCGHGI